MGGAFVSGMALEGARWNIQQGMLEKSKPREMYFEMPVVYCKSNFAASRPSTGNVGEVQTARNVLRDACGVLQIQLRGLAPVYRHILLSSLQNKTTWSNLCVLCAIKDQI